MKYSAAIYRIKNEIIVLNELTKDFFFFVLEQADFTCFYL